MIEPKYATLKTLFADRVFRIPVYQRFYSWGKRQRHDLFADIKKLAALGGDNHHFMATLVCHRTGETKPVGANEYHVSDVVDGQQRLTTLIVLLKQIEMHLDVSDEDRQALGKTLVKSDGHLVLLQTNNTNENMLTAFLKTGNEPDNIAIKKHADVNLRDAVVECAAFVRVWQNSESGLIGLLRLVQNRLGFVVYDTADSKVVYSIFEALNSRGLEVDPLDKCKSVIMGKAFELSGSDIAAEAEIGGLQKLWAQIYDALADFPRSGDEILRMFATLRYGTRNGKLRSASDALENIRSDCDMPDKPRIVTEQLLDITNRLAKLEKRAQLKAVTRILHARALAVAIDRASWLSAPEKKQALDQWERVTFRIFGLYRKDSRTKVGEYLRLAVNVETAALEGFPHLMGELFALGKDHPVEEAVSQGLTGKNVYDNPEACRYILWRYEESLAAKAGKNATIDEHERHEIWSKRAEDSIEHIFPQSPALLGPWADKMLKEDGAHEDLSVHVHRIGNLVLLPGGLNSEAKNFGFSVKKEKYQKHNLRMIHEIVVESDWTLHSIEEREKRIAEWASTVWADLP